MYEVKIINNGISTTIHYPTADIEAPHLNKIDFKESLSLPDALGFTILPNNQGYNSIEGLITKVKVTDLTDNKIVFSGRTMPVKSNMNSNGLFYKEVVCEGAMAYLNDSQTRRWSLKNQTPTQILTYLLSQHNAKMDSSRQINLGVIEITQPITLDTNYETTLNTIISKIKNVLGGDLKVRETNGLLYLDYLIDQGTDNGVKIELGYNMKDIIEEYDPLDIVSRVIPLGYGEGINQLDIKKVNSNIEYLDNSISIAKYGVIEGVATNKDIQSATTLKIYGNTVLKDKSQARLAISTNALDLSVLSGHESEKYNNGDSLNIVNPVMSIDVIARVVERSFDLLAPQNPQLTISTRAIRLTDQIIELKQRNLTLENAPMGSTCIFPISKAENADATHPVTLDLDIPKETININRVYINLHGRKYRANSKDAASGGGTTSTTASGGGTSSTSGSGGSSSNSITTPPASDYDTGAFVYSTVRDTVTPTVGTEHHHNLYSSTLAMIYQHTHSFLISIAAHVHNITIASHIHAITIASHIHNAIYGIVESATYPKNTKVKVNGVDIGINFGDGLTSIDEYDIDITSFVDIGNNKIEISTEENGRIDAIVYSQIFIQSK